MRRVTFVLVVLMVAAGHVSCTTLTRACKSPNQSLCVPQ